MLENKSKSVLKGNFQTKKDVAVENNPASKDKKMTIAEEVKKKALATLGGSMVYMERDKLSWDGE